MSRPPARRVARGSVWLAGGGVRLVWHALVIGGPWLYLPAVAGVLAHLAGFTWWWGTLAALVLGAVALSDGKDGFSMERFMREGHHRVEEARARAKALHVRREWKLICRKAGWVTDKDLEERRPVPSLRFARTMGRRLIVAWRPPESVPPSRYQEHVEELRRTLGAHSADYRPVAADPGTLIGMFGLQQLPDHVTPLGPVVGQAPTPIESGTLAVHQEPRSGERFVLGVGTGGTEVTWDPQHSAHMLVTGTTGGGKGSVLRTLTSQALAADWEVDVFDGQGAEYRWAEESGARVTNLDVEMAAERMAELEAHVNDVARVLWQHGVERWQDLPMDHADYRRLVILDDVLNFLMLRRVPEEKEADLHRSLFGSRLTRVAAQGRKVGVHLVIALQRADATLMGPAGGFLRSVLDARVAVGHLDEQGAAMMFDAGKEAALAYLDGTPGRAVGVGLHRGHVNPSPLQVHYLRAVDLRPAS